MYFSEHFMVGKDCIDDYGSVDISLICDLPLFIDPMLIFNSNKPEYAELHESIIRYFHFLYQKSSEGITAGAIKAWYTFQEVPNNWLGYSISGNKGHALGKDYANYLSQNIGFAIETNNISKGKHLEKVMLLYDGSGKDKISDLTVNLIKQYLCQYTEAFARQFINEHYCENFDVDRVSFNYETESYKSEIYYLPYIVDEKGNHEYVLLTPRDILRADEPAINRKDMIKNNVRVRDSIDNSELKAIVSNYIGKAVRNYVDNQKQNKKPTNEKTIKRIEEDAFKELLGIHPEIYDYYVALREEDSEVIKQQSKEEYSATMSLFVEATNRLVDIFHEKGYEPKKELTAMEEAKERLLFFKHEIEDCDGYKSFYDKNGMRITRESDLQRMFRLVWFRTDFKLDAEPNNGRGQADFIVSKGVGNQSIVEFKLASNSQLAHVFSQVKIYEKANCATGSLIVIFIFSEIEYMKSMQIIKTAGLDSCINESIFLIDCRSDNKKSASIA